MRPRIQLLAVLVFASTLEYPSTLAVRNFDIRWTWVNCTAFDLRAVEHFNCSIVELPKQRGNYISGQLRLLRNLDKILMEFILSTPKPAALGGTMEFFRVRTNACLLTDYKTRSTIVRATIKKLLQSSNFPTSCPLKGNFSYYVDYLSLNPDHFPPLSPEMDFNITIKLLSSSQVTTVQAVMGARLTKK